MRSWRVSPRLSLARRRRSSCHQPQRPLLEEAVHSRRRLAPTGHPVVTLLRMRAAAVAVTHVDRCVLNMPGMCAAARAKRHSIMASGVQRV